MGVEISQKECICRRGWEGVGIETLVPTIDGPDRRNVHVEDSDRFDQVSIVDLDGRTFS